MIVEEIDEYTADAAPLGADPRAAARECRVRFREAVDGAMEGNAARQWFRQSGWQQAFDKIAKDTTDEVGFQFSGKQGVGEKVHAQAVIRIKCGTAKDLPDLMPRRQTAV